MTKVAILAGGMGTRLAEETDLKPKPMVAIGERPILWHIMKCFSCFGLEDFYVATGYKGEQIKAYFADYRRFEGSIRVDLATGQLANYDAPPEKWTINLIDTGLATMTGGRIRRMRRWLDDGQPFIVTYGDGVSDVNITELLNFHRSHGKWVTVTAVRPPIRFGKIDFDGNRVVNFIEKPQMIEGWINGGFLVFEPKIFDFLSDDSDVLEIKVLERVAKEGQMMAYKHEGFWQCMDMLRDKRFLDDLWNRNAAPWKIW